MNAAKSRVRIAALAIVLFGLGLPILHAQQRVGANQRWVESKSQPVSLSSNRQSPNSFGNTASSFGNTAAIAAELDRLLATDLPELTSAESKVALVDDQAFLTRITLDLLGRNPRAAELRHFQRLTASDKREQMIRALLQEEEYGDNWARYWRDVIFYRRTDDRSQFAKATTQEYLRTQLNENAGWDEIATDFITATGDVREDGRTGLIAAQGGRPEQTAAEISRIFLGIQIQCAQCHDHPTDRWSREQFHELAAFMPRVASRLKLDGERRSITVVSNDRFPRRRRENANNRVIGTAEHLMPNLEDPEAPGTTMQPTFFVTNQSLPLGTKDLNRRGFLASWVTAKENVWFSKAFVNRIWARLIGEPLFDSIDDLGPDRTPMAPLTVDFLATQFAAQDYDIKWLLETIMQTEAYQRQIRPRRSYDETPFLASCAQRRTSDQIFASLKTSLGISFESPRSDRSPFSIRNGFEQTFGFDPSTPPAELSSSIPQALALMNSAFINNQVVARRGKISRLVRTQTDDVKIVETLYIDSLGRLPTTQELKVVQDYLKEVNDRREAFEDLQWALINSTEFLFRK